MSLPTKYAYVRQLPVGLRERPEQVAHPQRQVAAQPADHVQRAPLPSGRASKERVDKVTWLRERLRLTPLERLGWVYRENRDWNFHRVVGLYNLFLSRINNSAVREALRSEATDSYTERSRNELYAELKANSDGLVAELLRFVFSRRDAWSDRFYEYLIF